MTYNDYKKSFIEKHKNADWRVETSPMNEYDTYFKTYVFDDNAMMFEVSRPVYREVKAFVKELNEHVSVTVKLLEIECWTTEDSTSVKFYERW